MTDKLIPFRHRLIDTSDTGEILPLVACGRGRRGTCFMSLSVYLKGLHVCYLVFHVWVEPLVFDWRLFQGTYFFLHKWSFYWINANSREGSDGNVSYGLSKDSLVGGSSVIPFCLVVSEWSNFDIYDSMMIGKRDENRK